MSRSRSRPRWAARRRRHPPARRVDWFEGSRGSAVWYLAGFLGLPGFVLLAVVLYRFGSDGGATGALVMAAFSTWPTGMLAQDRADWDFGFRNGWVMVRYQTWTTLGGPVPQAVRCLRGAPGVPEDGDGQGVGG